MSGPKRREEPPDLTARPPLPAGGKPPLAPPTKSSADSSAKNMVHMDESSPIYLPPNSERMFTDDDLVFMGKVVSRSGLGDDTSLPPCMLSLHDPKPSLDDARREFECVVFDSVRDVLNKAGVHPRQVGVVVTNCSLFNPTP